MSPRKLADELGTDSSTVLAWERGELFPTRKACRQMEALRSRVPSVPASAPSSDPDLAPLADPRVWAVVRKLCRHDAFRQRVFELASSYDDVDG